MHIEIGDKYTVEGGASDFILYVKSIVKYGKTAGQETQQRLGYYSKLEHLIRALINHEIRTGEAKTLQEMQFTGTCQNGDCGEKVDKGFFCCSECREDYERIERAKQHRKVA